MVQSIFLHNSFLAQAACAGTFAPTSDILSHYAEQHND